MRLSTSDAKPQIHPRLLEIERRAVELGLEVKRYPTAHGAWLTISESPSEWLSAHWNDAKLSVVLSATSYGNPQGLIESARKVADLYRQLGLS